jgi:hypothetical protein
MEMLGSFEFYANPFVAPFSVRNFEELRQRVSHVLPGTDREAGDRGQLDIIVR